MNPLRNVSIPAAVLAVVTAVAIPVFVLSLAGCSSSGGYDVDDIYPDGEPSRVHIVSGDRQSAVAGTELPDPIVGKLVDLKGHTVPNRGVVFVVASGGGRVSTEATFSDGNGLVQSRWTLGTGAGTQKVEVQFPGGSGTPMVLATFEATATAGAGVNVTPVAGTNGQAAEKATALPTPVSVSVVDLQGNAKAGVLVTFAPCDGCGSAHPATAVTNAGGIASSAWTLGAGTGAQDLSASVAGLPDVRFRATAMEAAPRAPTRLVGMQGDTQAVGQHGRNAQSLRVFVTDALGDGVPGVAVDFAPAAGSGYFTAQTVNTGADGIADFSAYFHEAGAVRVEAAVTGLTSTYFDLAVTPAANDFDGLYDCRFADLPAAPFELAVSGNTTGALNTRAFDRALRGAITIGAEGAASASDDSPDAPATWSCERR